MPGPSVSITLFEPVAYLRGQSASGEARGRRHTSTIHHDAAPSQLRGLVTVFLPKPTRIKSVELTLSGEGRTDWPEGIGNNRIELAEVSQIIKQQVTLFDARAHDAPIAPPLRRAHSVGPGVGFGDQDDLDWSMADPQHRGGGASPGISRGEREREAREAAAKVAKSVGKAAAKAGSAILPPTLREMTGSGRSKDKEPKKQKSYDSRRSGGGSSSSSSTTAPLVPTAGPVSGSTTPVRTSFTMQRPQQPARYDPPPDYQQVETPPATASSSPSSSHFMQAHASPMQAPSSATPTGTPSLPSQSRIAAGPHGRSILHRREATDNSTTASASGASSSPSKATGTPGPALPTIGTSGSSHPVVRFGPPDEIVPPSNTTVTGRPRGMSGSDIINATQWPSATMQSASPEGTIMPSSAPSSRRPSLDRLTQALEAAVVADKDKEKANKGKGKASADGVRSPTLGKKSLKNLLGGGHRKGEGSGSSHGKHAASPTSSINGGRPGSSASRGSGAMGGGAGGGNTDVEPHATPLLNQPPCDWREFKKGTYTYSISLPLPANLPPTLYADFGRNTYHLKAVVKRSGPLTPNLSCEREVVMVHAPDEEGTEETEAIVVERTWEDALTYRVFVSGRSFACGSKIPLWIKFIPLGEKVRVWRLTAVLEEKTHYYAKGRKVARHETPRRWTFLKLMSPNGKPLVPIISDDPDALKSSVLADYAIAASEFRMPADARQLRAEAAARRAAIAGPSSRAADSMDGDDEDEEASQDALASLLDPAGPWELSIDLQLPGAGTRINLSTDHAKSSIAVHHLLRLTFRVEKADGSAASSSSKNKASAAGEAPKPKLYDIVIECPIAINHSRTSDIWLSLPNYWSVAGNSSALTPGGGGGGGDGGVLEQAGAAGEPDHYFAPRTSATSTPSTPATNMATPSTSMWASRGSSPSSSAALARPARSTPVSPSMATLGAPSRTLASSSSSGAMSPPPPTHATPAWHASFPSSAPSTPLGTPNPSFAAAQGMGRSASPLASPLASPPAPAPAASSSAAAQSGWRGGSNSNVDSVAARQSASAWLSLSTQMAAAGASPSLQLPGGAAGAGSQQDEIAAAARGSVLSAMGGEAIGTGAGQQAAGAEEEPPPYSGPPSMTASAATASAFQQPREASVTATRVETSTA